MAAADYRLMTETTGQRIAAALEALSGTGAAAAAARANLDVYSTGETDELIAQSTAGAVLGDKFTLINSPTTFNVPNLGRWLVLIMGNSTNLAAALMVSASNLGAVAVAEIMLGSLVSYTTGTNTLTITGTGLRVLSIRITDSAMSIA